MLGYQLLTGTADTVTGALLLLAPAMTMRWMRLHAAADALPFLSYVGVFVLSVGISCLYGAWIVWSESPAAKLQVVSLLTAITRSLVAAFVVSRVVSGIFPAQWLTVALTDGLFAGLQFTGLARGWFDDVQV